MSSGQEQARLHAPPSLVASHGASQIALALDNLLDNACKFTNSGGTVRVELSAQEGQATFSVIDDGIGIPPEDLPHIFNRFHRGRNTNAFPGSGLGLAIVKAIVNAHGGMVWAQSAGDAQGSQFSIRLPLSFTARGVQKTA